MINEDISEGESSEAGDDEDGSQANKPRTRSSVSWYAVREMEKWLHDNPQ